MDFTEIYLRKLMPSIHGVFQFSFEEFIANIKTGLPLTLGNFSSVLLTSIDRWFVKYLMDTVQFAQYSFAVSTEGIVNVALTPITITLYNYFCKHDNIEEIKELETAP